MNSAMALDPNAKSLKEILISQQRLLQKLYAELDEEREAAATAASEAMSMILRLQGEKSVVQMEAEQYKRLAEEKMNHAEESMEIFEEVMYQKEMEISSLEYQVQAYKYKLLSLGLNDLAANEIKYPESLLQRHESLGSVLQRHESLGGDTSAKVTPRRLKLPNTKNSHLERDKSITEDPAVIARIVEESMREDEISHNMELGMKAVDSSCVDINSYFEKIQDLDKIVEDMIGEKCLGSTAMTSKCSPSPFKTKELNHVPCAQKSIDDKLSSNTCSPSVHDVFEVYEVPEVDENLYKNEGKSISIDDEKENEVATFPQSPIKSYNYKEDIGVKKPLFSRQKDKVFSHKHSSDVECRLALLKSTTSTTKAQTLCQEMNMTSEVDEGETEVVDQNVRQEPLATRQEQEHELKLLYEINEKLSLIQLEIRSRNTISNESSRKYDLPMIQLREVYM
ncbi:zein-binding domain-containing protein [Artemisia annua]|uniref:Zein-binding domain-containing protein n=1 Tax=Artemisia annua TaxID=35608 RepID=A0A2U1KBI4_ARTAN|nr:zein-binding domain-containing protein [Artemisia annua]